MKSLSIKLKALLAIVVCLAVGGGFLVWLVHSSYRRNVDLVAQSSLDGARNSYTTLMGDFSKSFAVAASVMTGDKEMRRLFLERDRPGLLEHAKGLVARIDKVSVRSGLAVLDPEATIFIRTHIPEKFGDSVTHLKFVQQTMQTKKPASGLDLVSTGFSLATAVPYDDDQGKIIGYLLFGARIGSIAEVMKQQTQDDYLFVGTKSGINEKAYRASTKTKDAPPDTWDQFKDVLVVSKTAEPDLGFDYGQALKDLPVEGKVLGTTDVGEKSVVRGAFPMLNAAGQQLGAVFFEHDITALKQGMSAVMTKAIAAIVALMVVLCVLIAYILRRLIFARLERTMDVATRVVGGNFDTKIVPEGDDEVGKLEDLLEQFRTVFVDTASMVSNQEVNQVADDIGAARVAEAR